MKPNCSLLLAVLLSFASASFAQNISSIQLKNGTVQTEANIRQSYIDTFNTKTVRYNNKTFAALQFESIPTEETRKILLRNGIELLEYISNNAYTVSISGAASASVLEQAKAKTLVQLLPTQKMDAFFAKGLIPAWSVKVAGTVDVWISFPKSFSFGEVEKNLTGLNVDILSTQYQSYRILALRIATNRLTELASLPFIEYVQAAPSADQPLNYNSRYGSRANLLNASISNGGKGLNGEGVVVGIGDNADIQTHVDFKGRLINRAVATAAGHGHHTSGTVGGAGNINELYKGYAPKSTLVSQAFSGILTNAATYVQDYGMVITNNSYGNIIDCDYHGTYDLTSRLLDQMAFDLPNLENVFSAGNSGGNVCPPFAAGYRTVLGGYQSAKNVITVGATTDSGAISGFSSRGPVKDGRTKPEIVAMGQFVASTWPTNIYSYSSGTSMSGPAVSGGLALLYQRYRQLNSGANPKNGLMKAILCNGATDRGNAGPDYQYGFGWMNLLRSVEMIEKNNYFISGVANGVANTQSITVPAGTAQLKVMLYWNDPAASLISSKTLVNDLDLQVINTSGAIVLPGILDTTVANVGNAATTGADHINNMEQVIINNPAPGNYIIKVSGTAITQNPSQEYFVVYDVIPVNLKITAPAGGEGLVPGSLTKISWEANGFTSGTATLEFSPDNGTTWTLVNNNVDINRSLFSWWVPDVPTGQALIRITKSGSGETTTSNLFTIVRQPVVNLAPTQCEGYININWSAAAGATDYEVMILQGDEMKTVATTTGLFYTFSGLSKDSVYWVTVRARVGGAGGRRAVAVARQPNNGTCAGTISDNDLKLDAIVAPKSGRKFTSSQLSATSVISIRIKNLDDAAVNNFDVKYSINGGAWVTETVTTPVAGGATYVHNFSAPEDLSAVGNYAIVAVVKNSVADVVTVNDTAALLVKHLDNQPLNLTTYFVDNIETAASGTYAVDTPGLTGLDRYDFSRTTIYGRLRTFINSGIANSGSKAISLDADRYYPAGNVNYFYGTFNLGAYSTIANDLRLDFQFLNHGQVAHPANRVWIREDDTRPWIEVYKLDSAQNDPGIYTKSSSIELSDQLANAGQNLSSAFQVRWGQFGQLPATDKQNGAGYTFDDIRVYEVFNDLQLQSIDEPSSASCGLTSTTSVKISVRNSANSTLSNIPVKYRINNGTWVTETIASIAGNTTIQYTFATPADLSALGAYTLQSLVAYSSDSFKENDTASLLLHNTPVVSTFPYLQNFEANDGYWYASGKNVSWEYGTPASTKINRAASGAKAWKTRLQGSYNDNELSYLYSPCFDVTGMAVPTVSFSIALDIEDCGAQLCDGAWVEYSADGITWTKLGTSGSGTNWYNKSADQLWSVQNYAYWHVATTRLPSGLNRLRLRFVFASDPGVTRDGIAVDDIHVYDNTKGIYDSVSMTSPVSQNISGTNWVDFTNGGKLIASVHPNNQNLGATSVQAYIFGGTVRNNNKQYYHNRNITIQPATAPADSVTVRFYFLDREMDSLLAATSCSTCIKPSSAYELGISKYSDPDLSFENGSVADNQQGLWAFIQSDKVAKIPFDKGYYAEFKVKDFSEFWLNNGGFDKSTPLPVKLMNFTAQKVVNDVLLKWDVGSETSVDRYEIELARSNADLQAANFVKIGQVASLGNTTNVRFYTFTDTGADKFGARYYRLKIINTDGSFSYSPVRSVVFDEAVLWQVYPNPSKGNFYLVYQLNNGVQVNAGIVDVKGSLVKEYRLTADGFLQKISINLSGSSFASGVYLLKINAAGKEQVFKLYKQ